MSETGSSPEPSFGEQGQPSIDELVREDSRVQEIRHKVHEARQARDVRAEETLVDENKRITDDVRSELERQRGVYVDPADIERDQESARLDELARIKEHLPEDSTDEELLAAFRLVDEEGRPSIESPLFKSATRVGFDKYISSVRKFKAAVESGASMRNQGLADRKRADMHDEVARSVASDLGIDFDSARSLVAKIRDSKIPGSGESRLYARSVLHELERYGDDLGQLMADERAEVHSVLHPEDEDKEKGLDELTRTA